MDLLVSDSIRYNLKEIILKKDSVILFEQQKFQQSVTFIDNLQRNLANEKKLKKTELLRTGIVGASIGVILGILLAK